MGGGSTPGPQIGLANSNAIDDGTLARIGSPAPGAVGAAGKGPSAGAKTSHGTMADAIVGYAAQRLGHHEPDGQCFALVDRALREAGARSAADFGPVVSDEDYVWGTEVSLSDLTRGDVVQFRDYVYESVVVTETSEGTRTEEWKEGRPHHSAIVERVGENGAVTVLEQNSPDGAPVTRTTLYFRSGESEAEGRTTTITVSGTLWFYRPQPA
jgi:hypothetical protein